MPRNGRSSSITSTRLRSTAAIRFNPLPVPVSTSVIRFILSLLSASCRRRTSTSEQVAIAHRVVERLPDALARIGHCEGNAHDREVLRLGEDLKAQIRKKIRQPARPGRKPPLNRLRAVYVHEMPQSRLKNVGVIG